MFICWAGSLENVVHCSSVDVLRGLLDSLFGCLNVGVYLSGSYGFPTFASCLEHICAGWGGG